jgi:hypothetical protein
METNYDRVEEVVIDWHDLIDRAKWNRMGGREQEEYEAALKKKAQKPIYRAWRGDLFWIVSKKVYDQVSRGR